MTCCTIANIISRIDLAAFATVVIAIFTGCLVICNIYLWCSTKKAAEAAKESADVLVSSERAYLYIVFPYIENLRELEKPIDQVINTKNFNMTDDSIVDQPKIKYSIRNYGKSPGIVKEISHSLIWNKKLPNSPIYNPIETVFEEYMIASNEQGETITCNPNILLRTRDVKEIIDGKSFFWFYGRVMYDDILGKGHEHRFVWLYIHSKKQLRPYYEIKEYNKNT
jgi:hypothetical protein